MIPANLNSLDTIIRHEEAEKEKAENDKKIAKGNRDSTYHDGFEKNKGPILNRPTSLIICSNNS